MQRVKKGDTVEVIAGRDIGERGEVITVLKKENRVIVDGINIRKKHEEARQVGNQQIPAQIVSFDAPLNLSNVMPVCPSCGERTRVGYRRDGGRKTRFCKKCDESLD